MIKKNLKLNPVKKRLLVLSPIVKDGIERESNKDDFEALEDKALGQGGYGLVWKVRNKNSGNIYAIKVINKSYIMKENMIDQMNREIEIMYRINHPHIIKLYNHYEDDESFYLIMELASKGQLYSLLKKLKKLDEKTAAKYLKEIISAVSYLHSLDQPIIHRDIKPENILLDNDNRAKLADFGWSNFLEGNKTRDTLAGTPEYLAPEMVMKSGHDFRVDIWSIGVLMFELLAGRPPFVFKGDISVLYSDIKTLKIKWTEDFPILAKDLVSKILRIKPNDRISLAQALEHPWFKETLGNKPKEEVVESHNNSMNNFKLGLMTTKSDDKQPSTNITQKQSNVNNNNNENKNIQNNHNLANSIKIKNIIKKRESLKGQEIVNDTDSNSLITKSLKQEIKIKEEENVYLKQQVSKLQDLLKEYSTQKSQNNEDEDSLLTLKEREKKQMIEDLEKKNKKFQELEYELNLVKSDNEQLKLELNDLKRINESNNKKKLELENEIVVLKSNIQQLEEEKQNVIINYEKQIRQVELKSINSNNAPTTEYFDENGNNMKSNTFILRVQEMTQKYLKELDECINKKFTSLEEKVKSKEAEEIDFRRGLIDNIDNKISTLIENFKSSYGTAINEEKKLFTKQLEDLNDKNNNYLKNIEWYKTQISELYPFKQKYKLVEEKIESTESYVKELEENKEILSYQIKSLEQHNTNLKDTQNRYSIENELFKNALKESEKLFSKYNGKNIRELLNLKDLNF